MLPGDQAQLEQFSHFLVLLERQKNEGQTSNEIDRPGGQGEWPKIEQH